MTFSEFLKNRHILHLQKVLLVSVSGLLLMTLFYLAIFWEKFAPNTYFASVNIGAKNTNDALDIVEKNIQNFEKQKIVIIVGNKRLEFLASDIGIVFEKEETLKRIIQENDKNFLKSCVNKLSTLIFARKFYPKYRIDYAKIENVFLENFQKLEKMPVDATIVFEGRDPKIAYSQRGLVVNRSKLARDLNFKLYNLLYDPIIASYIEVEPQIRVEGAQKALEKVKALNKQNIVLSHGYERWILSGQNLLSLLRFYPEGQKGYGVPWKFPDEVHQAIEGTSDDDTKFELQVELDGVKLDEFIGDIAVSIDKPTIDATLEFDGQKVTKFTPAQDGTQLNKIQTKKLVLAAVSVENLSKEKNIEIKLPVTQTPAKIANEAVNSLGIKELLASGFSYFAGSIPNRVHNIALGSSFVNGTIIKPGEIFSFNALVGPVSADQGFKQAYVIQKGRTVLDDGGGICQVSTTVFRAALNAGLPIVKRTAHAYRVAYYEQKGFKAGFDATVFSPTVDFQFKNDTGNHILVQAKVDRVNVKLQVDIYGTRDGRRVEISDPVISNVTPAPSPKYEEDPTLPRGATKQVDFAADGATSIFFRKVYKNDQLIIDDTFSSNFRPWQAVYLVGTGG